jgi:biopolymer transport protein ExbD
MRRFPNQPRKRTRIEIIPMIDVMMFLLVFFVLISINVIPALGLKMKLPQSSQAREDHPPKRVILGISAQGEFLLDGVEFRSLESMQPSLIKLRDEASANGGDVKKNLVVIINGDQESKLQQLVDVMDLLKSNGIDSMTIASKKK